MFISIELFNAFRVSYKAPNEGEKVLENDLSFTCALLVISKAWLTFFFFRKSTVTFRISICKM